MSKNDYYFKMKSLVEDLRCARNQVTDDELVLYLLKGLGPEYDLIMVNISSRENKLPFHEVYSMLLSHENRVDRNLSSATIHMVPNPSGNFVKQSYNNFPRRNWSGGVYQNQYTSHQNQSWGNTQAKRKERNLKEEVQRPTSQICLKNVHNAYTCWYKLNKKFALKLCVRGAQKKAYIAALEIIVDPTWYLDSRTTNNVTNNLENLTIGLEYKGKNQLVVGNGNKLAFTYIGNSILPIMHPQTTKHLILKHMLHVPAITENLISISKLLEDNDINVLFDGNLCLIKDKSLERTLL